jgi:hypothetical protein
MTHGRRKSKINRFGAILSRATQQTHIELMEWVTELEQVVLGGSTREVIVGIESIRKMNRRFAKEEAKMLEEGTHPSTTAFSAAARLAASIKRPGYFQ